MTAPPPDDEERWRALAARAVGDDFGRLRATVDGLAIEPLYPRRTTDPAQPWARVGDWAIAQRVDHPAPEAANRLALLDLDGGADALTLVFAGSPYARGFGLAAESGLDGTLAGIELDFISLRVDAGTDAIAAAQSLGALVEARRLTSAGLAVDLGWDPVGLEARTGASPVDALPRLLEISARAGLSGRVMLADARPWHEAGAGAAQELAAALATGIAYLRRLEAQGLSLDGARRQVAVLLAADADLFPGLAKFRAMRRLWARVELACDLVPVPLRLHAETSWRMMTRHDPWTNTMRATAAAFAAGLGGADTIGVLPMTLACGLPDADARRLARNVSRVLLDEAHLGRLDDPAAGSGALETLTETLCEQAWAAFQAIEREGGILAALHGPFRDRIAAVAAGRASRVAEGTRGIVGTSLHASPDAPGIAVLDVAARPALTPTADVLPCRRESEPLEASRGSEEHRHKIGNKIL